MPNIGFGTTKSVGDRERDVRRHEAIDMPTHLSLGGACAWLVTVAASQREIEAGTEVLASAGERGLVRRGSVDDVDQTEHHVVGRQVAQHPTVVFDDRSLDFIEVYKMPSRNRRCSVRPGLADRAQRGRTTRPGTRPSKATEDLNRRASMILGLHNAAPPLFAAVPRNNVSGRRSSATKNAVHRRGDEGTRRR